MPPFTLRLSYSPSTSFSLVKTIIGCLIITLGILAVIVATIWTKGWMPSHEVVYLSDLTDPAYICNSTLVSPGQTFFHNSTFVYQASNSFSYTGEVLQDCKIANGTARIGVYGPPTASPRLDWELPISCQIGGSLYANFSPAEIVLFNGPDQYHADDERRSRYISSLWGQVISTAVDVLNNIKCGPFNATAYKAYEDRNVIDFFPGYAAPVCSLPLSNDGAIESGIRSFIAEFKAAVLDDFAPGGQRIGPLPGLLYACSPHLRTRAPWRQIAFECFTNAAAIFSPLYAAVIWLLQYIPRDPSWVPGPRGLDGYTEVNEDQGLRVGQMFPLLHSPGSAPEQSQSTFSPYAQATQ